MTSARRPRPGRARSAGPAGQPGPVHPAGRGQRPRRRHARPGTHRPAAAGRARVRTRPPTPPALTFILAFGVAKAATNYLAGTLVRPVRPQTGARRRLAGRGPGAAAADLGAVVGLGGRRQRAARRQPGADLVDHGHHEDRPRRPGPPRARDGAQRGRRLRRRRGHRAGHRLPRRQPTGCARSRSTSASPTPRSDSACPRWPSARPATTPASRQHPHAPRADGRHDHLHGELTDAAGVRRRPASASRRCPRPARPGWSTTSTTASPGGCSRCCSPPPGLPSAEIGVLAALYPAVWGLGQLVTGAAVGPDRPQAADRRRHAHSRPSPSPWSPSADTFAVWAAGRRPARRRHRDGLPDPARRDRRRRPPDLAGPRGRRLPAVARRRLRRRRPRSPA